MAGGNQFCIFKPGRRFKLRMNEKHTQPVLRAGIPGLRVRRAHYLATLPPHGTIPRARRCDLWGRQCDQLLLSDD